MDARTVYSFASAQSALPAEILEAVEADIARHGNGSLPVVALPFTCEQAGDILHDAQQRIRDLLAVPDGYEVLFLQGGAYALFGTIAMNFGGAGRVGAYIVAGHWSQRAAVEAEPWINVRHAAHGDGCSLPAPENWNVPQAATYCHYTSNESAEGLQFPVVPRLRAVPLISDMTADFLTRPLDMRNFGLVYASSQKNLGIAGLTVVILSKSLLRLCSDKTPAPFDFRKQARERSKVNTPPLFAIAVARHVCRWLQDYGGLEAAKERSNQKARLIYRMIDENGFYSSPVDPEFRSRVSIRFHLPTPRLESAFLDRARANGLLHLQGHPDVGGIRVSLYNLVPLRAVEVLCDFMEEFRRVSG